MQLVQTDMQCSHEDSAADNLQQYSNYMVVSHPTDTAAAQDSHQMGQLPDGSHTVAVYSDDKQQYDSNHAGAVQWYGSYGSGAVSHAALASHAGHPETGEPFWTGQQALQEAAMAKKGQPADVSRHDTPTSVFDIFNSLDISGTTSAVPVASQQQHHQHNSGMDTTARTAVVHATCHIGGAVQSGHIQSLPGNRDLVQSVNCLALPNTACLTAHPSYMSAFNLQV